MIGDPSYFKDKVKSAGKVYIVFMHTMVYSNILVCYRWYVVSAF